MVFSSLLPDEDFGGISGETRREIIRNYLPGLIEEGFSANASLTLFQDVGLGIGRSDYLGIYREVLGLEEQQNRIRFVTGNSIPSEGILGDLQYDIQGEYRFVYKYSYLNSATGDVIEQYAGVDRDFLDSVNNMEADAADYIREKYLAGSGELLAISIWKGFKAS